MKTVATVVLTGGSSQLDYASVDSQWNRLYISHLGGGLVIVFDTLAVPGSCPVCPTTAASPPASALPPFGISVSSTMQQVTASCGDPLHVQKRVLTLTNMWQRPRDLIDEPQQQLAGSRADISTIAAFVRLLLER